jgi:hypothetical protein
MGKVGLLAGQSYPGAHLKNFKLLGDLPYEKFDYFHELITHYEVSRLMAPGVLDGLKTGMVIGLPPVIKYA